MHVHTNDPGLALQRALTFGSLSRIKIDNMREEHEERLIKDAERVAREQKEEELKAQEAQEVSERPRKERVLWQSAQEPGWPIFFEGHLEPMW